MKKLLGLFLGVILSTLTFAQSGPPAPSSGNWVIIDTNYIVGTTTAGHSFAKITLKNTTPTLVAGVQFRVFYDKNAFSAASVSLIGSTTNLDLQQLDNNAGGYTTITLVYTGASDTYDFPEAETFNIDFTHVSAASFMALPAIGNLTFSGVATFPNLASAQSGNDIPLLTQNYGGIWYQPHLAYHGTFTNVTGTPAKNLTLALEKKPHTGTTWSQHATYTTDINGHFAFNEIIDTTFYDVRLAIKGDTMGVGNVISTADAQLINQWAIGGATPTGWDFFTADVNGDKSVSISDAFGVFGKIAGRISVWPNSVQNVKFYTPTEYAAINGSSVNLVATYPGQTNFYYDILPGQPDSVSYYVMVPGDANGTGYHMARVTPIEVLINPTPGVESQTFNVIDTRVEYDFPTQTIEVNVPHLSVQEGNLVNIPVTLRSNGVDISSMQFGLSYNNDLLEFKGVEASQAAQKWLTYVNPLDSRVDWGGFDKTNNENVIRDGEQVVTLQFVALKPQLDWNTSPLYTTEKYAGQTNSKDLSITPANGILQVFKMVGGHILSNNTMEVYPNPTKGPITIGFKVSEPTLGSLKIFDVNGTLYMTVMEGNIPQGQYKYSTDLGSLSDGMYTATLVMENGKYITKKIIKQN